MQKELQILEFNTILEKLESFAHTSVAKEKCKNVKPYLSESELMARLNETTEAREVLDQIGLPPLVSLKEISHLLVTAKQGGMLLAEELEYVANCLMSTKRIKEFLERCKKIQVGLGYYSGELEPLDDIRQEIEANVRDGAVDDYASKELRDIRRLLSNMRVRVTNKAEELLRTNKAYCSDSFISHRSGHICLPIKKEYKGKVKGSVIDQSQTGATVYMEPEAIAKMKQELDNLKLQEDNEERRILYTLSSLLVDKEEIISKNTKIIETLDFIFAKGRLSQELQAKKPTINTQRIITIKKGRHPLLEKEKCVPLDFTIGMQDIRGIIITGPNTGGKTVSLKTVGLLSIMAQCGLHIPCEEASIAMNSQVLCDIGDGQNIAQNLSTFSAHITNILSILETVNEESLVLLDELGSGTDPAEGMGIAISILEELKKSGCLFLATTHYPEVKTYAEKEESMINAKMGFDKETLKPLYRLEIGKAGESCALSIAKKLGMPNHMLQTAYRATYQMGESNKSYIDKELENQKDDLTVKKEGESKKHTKPNKGPKIEKKKEYKQDTTKIETFQRGDSVEVYPEKKIGIVCQKANDKGDVLVQIQKQKVLVNHKRLKLKITASQLYPEDYDFSIIFDSVENRKARHQISKRHRPDLVIKEEE